MQIKDQLILIVRIVAVILFSSPLPLMSQYVNTAAATHVRALTQMHGQTFADESPNNDSLPLCPSGQEYDAGLCYPKCQAGYSGIGPVCWKGCPDGYTNDGALCRKDAVIVPKESYGRGAGAPLTCSGDEDQDGALCYPKCSPGYQGIGPVCWQTCPDGYTNTGLTCHRPVYSFAKDSYGRGIGTIPNINGSCPSGKEKDAGLCYNLCNVGYYGIGPVCWQSCPDGFTNDGAFCRRPSDDINKASYGRGVGVPLHACGTGEEQDGALCYPKCSEGYYGIGPVCWKYCSDGFTNDGAICRKDAIIVPKESYGRGAGSVPNCDINNLDCAGNFEVSSTFRPQPWGYHFSNWGQDYDNSTDLDTPTLIRMFGMDVCQAGTTISNCVLKATVRDWRANQLESAQGGHCYGLAVSSQMFFGQFDKPAVYFPTAANTYAMDASAAVRGHITEMFVTQGLTFTNGTPSGVSNFDKTPSEILDLIRTNLRDTPNDPYVLAIYNTDDTGKVVSGHAVTPFAIENRGNNIYWVHIYDNNKPNTDRYIVFDVAQETWLYGFGSENPGEPEGAWKGDAKTHTLSLALTSIHKLGGWFCPTCDKNRSLRTSAAEAANAGEAPSLPVQFTLVGGGSLLVRDAQNHTVGWDFVTKTYVNGIAGASRQFIIGGAGGSLGSLIRLPLQMPVTPYSVTISGDGLTQTLKIRLAMTGPGYTLNVNDVALAPGMHLLMTFWPDGRQVTFNADATGTFTPTITLANDYSAGGNSDLFDVSGITLSPSKTMTVSLNVDGAQGTALHFGDNTTQSTAYKIELLRITPQGEEQHFMTDQAVVTGGSDAMLNVGAWDGSNEMPFTRNGETHPLQNQVRRNIFIPMVTKH